MSRGLTEMLDSLREAREALDEIVSSFLDADPTHLETTDRLHELSARNAQSARLIQHLIKASGSGEVQPDLWRGELEEIAVYFETAAASLAARLSRAGGG